MEPAIIISRKSVINGIRNISCRWHVNPNGACAVAYIFCTYSHHYFRLAKSLSSGLGYSRMDHKSAKLNSLCPVPAYYNSRLHYITDPFLRFCLTSSLDRVSLLIAFSPHSFQCRNNLLGRYRAGCHTVDSKVEPLGLRFVQGWVLANISTWRPPRFPACPSPSHQPPFSRSSAGQTHSK